MENIALVREVGGLWLGLVVGAMQGWGEEEMM